MNLLLVVGVGFFLLAVGALLGRYYVPDRRPLKRAAKEGQAYVRGLVELLEGDRDSAIDEITRALRDNTKTVEAYFALGALFRQRGDHERAVRVHQAILIRRDVDKKTKLRVHRQLALDFGAAGFSRRAVKALEFVVAQDKKDADALRELAQMYEQTRRWEHAAAAQRRLAKLEGEPNDTLQAHLLTQHAQERLEAGDLPAARKALRRALSADASSVHALHVLARYQRRRNHVAAAVKAWQKALSLRPELIAFFYPHLESALYEIEKLPSLDILIKQLIDEHPANVHLRLAFARMDAKRNPKRALGQLEDLLAEHPALLPARKQAAKLVIEQGDPQAILAAFEELLELLDDADRGYRCADCGHAEADLFWRCEKCHRWGSVRVAWGRRAGERRGGATS